MGDMFIISDNRNRIITIWSVLDMGSTESALYW